jgi:hypothetical protein
MAEETGSTRSALILYGSETGNAQEVAEELGRTAERLHFVTHVKECNGVKAVSGVPPICCQISTDDIQGQSGLTFTRYICRINFRPRRLSAECACFLEDTSTEKTPRNFSQRRQIHAVWAR